MRPNTGSPEPRLPADDETLWAAVAARDEGWDDRFVYGVTSTGVYCRPSCASRRPRGDRVRFFATADDAEGAGFRACRRCAPRDARTQPTDGPLEDAARYLEAHADERVTLERLSAEVGLSPSHLQRTFSRRFGMSPRRYQTAIRTEALRRELHEGERVSDAGYRAGFGSSRALYEHADRGLGMTPGVYRRGGAGLVIRYTVLPSPLGWVLVGVTERGVCSVLLDDDEDAAVADLAAEFPRAELERDDAGVGTWAAEVVAYAAGRSSRPSLPLDLQGTSFQRRVWAALQELPEGATATYSDVAGAIGEPKAVRAVAGACAGNHVSLLVPCHRVVRRDGGIGGYKWGVEPEATHPRTGASHGPGADRDLAPRGAGGQSRALKTSDSFPPSSESVSTPASTR